MPELPDLSGIFNRPPEEIVEQFRSKGYAVSWNWRDVWQQSHSRAFTVAKAVNQNVLESIRGEVDKALAEGTTFRQFQKNLEPRLKELGWWGKREIVDPETGEVTEVQLGSPWRLKNIYRTNLTTSYAAGRYKVQEAATARRPWWIYRSALLPTTRDSHEKKHGTVARYDHPFWIENYPPNDWGCKCGVDSLSDRQLEARGLKPIEGDIEGIAGEGWDYNPGAAPWQPITPRQGSLSDFLPVTDDTFDTAGPLSEVDVKPGSLLSRQLDDEAYTNEFISRFGVSPKNPKVIDDVAGDPILISDVMFKDSDGNYRFEGGEYADMLAQTIQEPGEIWLDWLKSEAGYHLNRRYISGFDLDGRTEYLSFEVMDGNWLWRVLDPEEVNEYRSGFLRYKEEQ